MLFSIHSESHSEAAQGNRYSDLSNEAPNKKDRVEDSELSPPRIASKVDVRSLWVWSDRIGKKRERRSSRTSSQKRGQALSGLGASASQD